MDSSRVGGCCGLPLWPWSRIARICILALALLGRWPQVRLLASVGLDCPTCNMGITQPVRRRAAVQTGGPTRVIHVRGPVPASVDCLTVASTRAHTLRRSRCISRCFPPPHSAPEIHPEEAVAATAKNPAEQKRRSKARSGPRSSGNQRAAGQSVKKSQDTEIPSARNFKQTDNTAYRVGTKTHVVRD